MKAHEYEARIRVRAAGIPALAGIIQFVPAEPGRYCGRPEDCYPAERSEIEWVLLDRKGYPARWLEEKIGPAGMDALEDSLVFLLERGDESL